MTNRLPLWHSDRGDGPILVALHPGGTDSRALEPLLDHLTDYRLITIDRPGHGRSADVHGEWRFDEMAGRIADVLDGLSVRDAHVVGWSDGSIVGLHLALSRPELVRSLVFGGAAFDRSGWREGVLDGEPPPFMAEAYAEVSPDGAEHWGDVVRKASDLHRVEPNLTTRQLESLSMPVLVLSGDDDEIRFEHLIAMYEALPDGELCVVPRSTHGLIVEKPGLLAQLIREFHAEPRTNGLAPIRRA